MSKVGKKPIALVEGQKIEIQDGREIKYQGKQSSGTYVLPKEIIALIEDGKLRLIINNDMAYHRDMKKLLGLHRARLANTLAGADKKFERELRINGLGFKAVLVGKNIQFSLGYSHKIDYVMPPDVSVDIDKTGQILLIRCSDKEHLGLVASQIRDLRPPEPYKGTGIQYAGQQILRKVGKTK